MAVNRKIKQRYYLEDWSEQNFVKEDRRNLLRDVKNKSVRNFVKESMNNIEQPKDNNSSNVSVALVTKDLFLTKNTNYELRFNIGILEGEGIIVNNSGDLITFSKDGSYKFEIVGEADISSETSSPRVNIDVDLIYFNKDFADDILLFSRTRIPKNGNKLELKGIPTILPMNKGQTISIKLVPSKDININIMDGTRLLIYKVA